MNILTYFFKMGLAKMASLKLLTIINAYAIIILNYSMVGEDDVIYSNTGEDTYKRRN